MAGCSLSGLSGLRRSPAVAAFSGALLAAGLSTVLQAGSSPALAAEPDRQRDSEGLRGLVYRQRPETIGLPIDTPGIWIGLPSDVSYLGGHLLRTPGNVESSQSLGVARMRISGGIYYVFDLTSNHQGRTDTRILDAVFAPAGKAMQPCDVAGEVSEELVAILDQEEARLVAVQQPSQIDLKTATLTNPRHLVRFNPRSLSIERVVSDQARCVGYPF